MDLYTGLSAGLLRQAVYTTARLGFFDTFSNLLASRAKTNGTNVTFVERAAAGLSAGGLAAMIGNPAGSPAEDVMGLIILLVVGGLIGWVASIIMRTDGQQGIFLSVVVGIVGAMLAGFLLTPLIGGVPITSGVISLPSILVSLLGAVVLLGIVNLFRRGSVC